MKSIEEIIIASMVPNMQDYIDTTMPQYWDQYCDQLEEISLNIPWLILGCNNIFLNYNSTNGRYNACVDIASTLESLAPEKYAGKFKY